MSETTRRFRVYGFAGRRQRVSFMPSKTYDCSSDGKTRIVEMINSDKTGTNDYTELVITADNPYDELEAQLFDGLFKDSRVGKITEIVNGNETKYVYRYY